MLPKATAKTCKRTASNVDEVVPAKRACKAKQPALKQPAANDNDHEIAEDLEEDKGGPGKKTPVKGQTPVKSKRGGRVAVKMAGEAVVKCTGKAPQYIPPPTPFLRGLTTSTARHLRRRRLRSRG
jgi:hypothetical protein